MVIFQINVYSFVIKLKIELNVKYEIRLILINNVKLNIERTYSCKIRNKAKRNKMKYFC